MKYCVECERAFDTDAKYCPLCGAELRDERTDEEEAAETIAMMTILNIL